MGVPSKQLHMSEPGLTKLVMDPICIKVVQQAIYPDGPCVWVEGFS